MKYRLLAFVFVPLFVNAQQMQTFTLTACYDSAVNNYPNLHQIDLNRAINELKKKNIKTTYYPKLSLNGQASYQSDVTKVPTLVNIPGFSIPELEKDWYKINLDIEQMIYDGGLTSNRKKIEDADLRISDQKILVEIYQLKERVNNLFFSIVYLNKSRDILNILIKNLDLRLADANKAYQNGMLLQSDLDAINVEISSGQQKIIEFDSDIEGLLASLNEICGLDIKSPYQLKLTDIQIADYNFINNRPEYQLLSLQQEKVNSLKSLSTVKRMPVFVAFGQMGYGRPGYDMLKNEFDDYYMVGLRLRWSIWDWGRVMREKQVFDIQNSIINSQKATFEQALRADMRKKVSDINKYHKLIEADEKIVKLQENVLKTAASQMDNGTITTGNYLIEVNKKLRSDLNLEAHKLQLIYSKILYLTSIGKNQ
ncbi:MAG: TolC family protein [Chlorobi bacterium]|nr:TolC family protein [Chlorobiota bacterium]